MKKEMKKIILMFFMAFSAIVLNAQTAVQTSKVLDNTFIGVEGGVATPLSFDGVFPLNATTTLRVGKLFTPIVGAEIEGTAWFGSHADYANRFDGYDAHNAIRGSYVGVNGLVNLTNLFWDYNGTPRKFELSAVAGTGWVHTYTPHQSDKYKNHLGAKTGLDFAFNLGKSRAHTISVRPAVLWNLSVPGSKYGQLAFNKHGAQLYVGLGYTYHFKTSNGTHSFKLYDIGAMNNEINRLQAELAKKPTEVVKTNVIEREVIRTVDGTERVVYFALNSDVLTAESKAVLDNVKGSVKVEGYASPEGTEKYNKELSQRRANVVAEYLRSKGVTVTDVVGCGVVGDTSNRVAVVTNE